MSDDINKYLPDTQTALKRARRAVVNAQERRGSPEERRLENEPPAATVPARRFVRVVVEMAGWKKALLAAVAVVLPVVVFVGMSEWKERGRRLEGMGTSAGGAATATSATSTASAAVSANVTTSAVGTGSAPGATTTTTMESMGAASTATASTTSAPATAMSARPAAKGPSPKPEPTTAPSVAPTRGPSEPPHDPDGPAPIYSAPKF